MKEFEIKLNLVIKYIIILLSTLILAICMQFIINSDIYVTLLFILIYLAIYIMSVVIEINERLR